MTILLPSPHGTYTVRHRQLTRDAHGRPVPAAPVIQVVGLPGRTRLAGDTTEVYLDEGGWPACDLSSLAVEAEVLVTGPDPAGTVRTWVLTSAALRIGSGAAGALSYITAAGVRADL